MKDKATSPEHQEKPTNEDVIKILGITSTEEERTFFINGYEYAKEKDNDELLLMVQDLEGYKEQLSSLRAENERLEKERDEFANELSIERFSDEFADELHNKVMVQWEKDFGSIHNDRNMDAYTVSGFLKGILEQFKESKK